METEILDHEFEEADELEILEETEYNEELEALVRIIYLKYLLIAAPELDLVGDFSSVEKYSWFVDALRLTLENELPFFLLDERFLKSAEDVLYSKRFEYNHIETFNEMINDVIFKINKLRSLSESEKATGIKNYASWNKRLRQLPSNISQKEFLRTLAYDSIVLEGTMDGEIPELPSWYITASINYIATLLPEFYEEYPVAYVTTMAFLESETKKRGFWHTYERKSAERATKQMQYIKRKEE